MRNIANAFVRLGQFQDAIQSFEAIMDACPDSQTGFNLIVCYYARGDKVVSMQTRAFETRPFS
jgi:intraflagellar transport protein 88